MAGQPKFSIGHLRIVDHLIIGVVNDILTRQQKKIDLSTFETRVCHSWTQMSELLVCGDINGAFITIPMAMDLYAKGLDIRLLMFTHRGGSMIVKNSRASVGQIKDFAGRSVLIPNVLSTQHMLLHRLMDSAGLLLDNSDAGQSAVFPEAVSPYLMPVMLQQDTDFDIAGCAVHEPFGSQAIDENSAVRVCNTGRLWENHPCCAFVLHNSFIREHSQAVAQLVRIFLQAAREIDSCMEDTLAAIGPSFLKQSEKVVKRVVSGTDLCFNPAMLIPDLQQIQNIQDYMADTMHVLQAKIDIDTFVDTSFISAAEE